MNDLKDKNLAFFMDFGSSLKLWDELGLLQREIVLYNLLAKKFKKIYFFTYGDQTDLAYKKYLAPNIEIVPKKPSYQNALFDLLYEISAPLIHYKKISQCSFLKSNQNLGSLMPTVAKIIHPKAKLIIRNGYVGSEFARISHHPWHLKLYLALVERLSYHLCDQAFTAAKTNYDILINKYPYLQKKLLMINNYIDTNLFKKLPEPKKYDLIYVARLDYQQKNHQALLEAIKGLNLNVLLVGQGPIKEEILAYGKKNDIKITILDKVPNNELPQYYNSTKMFASPSLHEGNPKAIMEAMSCQLPVVAFDVAGINSLIENEKTGLISPVSSTNLEKNIQKILKNTNLAENLGQKAREFIVENFSLEKMLQRELNAYQQLI